MRPSGEPGGRVVAGFREGLGPRGHRNVTAVADGVTALLQVIADRLPDGNGDDRPRG